MKSTVDARPVVSAILLAAVSLAAAHETDNFTPPGGDELADISDELMAMFEPRLQRVVDTLNARIDRDLSRGVPPERMDKHHDPDLIAKMVRAEFPLTPLVITELEYRMIMQKSPASYHGALPYWRRFDWVYNYGHLPVDPRQLILAFRASTVRVGDTYQGTDKYGHFIIKGIMHYRLYRRLREDGATHEEAVQGMHRASNGRNWFNSEAGLFGMTSSGVWSSSDLAADHLGGLFFINLTETVNVAGRECPSIMVLEADGVHWRLNDHVRSGGPLIDWYFNHAALDEARNPSVLQPLFHELTANRIRNRSVGFLHWRADPNGLRPGPLDLETWAMETRTLNGQDYGYTDKGSWELDIAEICYPASRGADPRAPNLRGDNRLLDAARRGDVVQLQEAVAAGVPVNAGNHSREQVSSDWGATGLMLAAKAGSAECVDELLKAGASVSAADASGRGALHWAADQPASIRTLLSSGAPVASADEQGRTALHHAARLGNASSIAALLARGARVDGRDLHGRTALHEAAAGGHLEVLRTLLGREASPNARDQWGQSPLLVAAIQSPRNQSVVNALLRAGGDPHLKDATGLSASVLLTHR